MIAERTAVSSDILAATGKAGMGSAGEGRFWDWRRLVLAIGYALVFVAGLLVLIAADPTGLVLMAAAVIGLLFIHRTWLGVGIWIYVITTGLVAIVSGDDLGLWGILAGLGFGIVALPIWKARRQAPRQAYTWSQSPFQTPPPAAPTGPTSEPVALAAAGWMEKRDELPQPSFPRIRTIGRIQLRTPEGDVTARLIGKPVIGFLWLYLLARSVRNPGDRLTRSAITDEVAPGVSDPRGRLRGYLRDLARMPQPFGAMVQVNDELIGFDLGGCEADFAELRSIAARVRESAGRPDDELLGRAQSVLKALGDGEFMPGFEDIEKRATSGRGVAGQVVAEVRVQVEGMRADVADAVGKALLDRGQAALAVSILEPLVARSEERDDLARTLINALRESGQHARAADIRRRFAVGQES